MPYPLILNGNISMHIIFQEKSRFLSGAIINYQKTLVHAMKTSTHILELSDYFVVDYVENCW